MERIPVIFATDDNYLLQTYVSVLSILENANQDDYYDIFILLNDNKDTDDYVKCIHKKYNNCNISFVNMNNQFSNVSLRIKHITVPTYYRLRIASILKQYDKAIYLDSDVIVELDLKELFDIELEDNYIAASKAPMYHIMKNPQKYCESNDIPAIDNYVNAGVLVFNLRKIREDNIEEEFCRRVLNPYQTQDQDVINGVCYGKIKFIGLKYNVRTVSINNESALLKCFSEKEINEAKEKNRIIHYADKIKPWNDCSCMLADRWLFYLELLNSIFEGGI